MKTKENTIVAFKIGRGGRFNNQGHLSFLDVDKGIDKFTQDLFTKFENEDNFKNRFGFSETNDENQKSILDLLTDYNFDELEEKFGITEKMLGDEIYTNDNGNPVGLTVKEAETGIGRIDIDGEYNTIYTCFLCDCDEKELNAIENSNHWDKEDLLKLFNE